MNDCDFAGFVGFLAGLIIAGLIGGCIVQDTKREWKEKAVAHGCAYFELNPTNGTSTFRWKDEK